MIKYLPTSCDLSVCALEYCEKLAKENDLGKLIQIVVGKDYEKYVPKFPSEYSIKIQSVKWLDNWVWFAQYEYGIIPSGILNNQKTVEE
jgi:hypothetical protein